MLRKIVSIGEDGDYEYPRLKRFLSEVGGLVPVDIWDYGEDGHD